MFVASKFQWKMVVRVPFSVKVELVDEKDMNTSLVKIVRSNTAVNRYIDTFLSVGHILLKRIWLEVPMMSVRVVSYPRSPV